MRKILILIVCVLLLASGCMSHEEKLIQQAEDRWLKESEYDKAYQEGYEAGRDSLSSSYNNGYEDGFNEGFAEGYAQYRRDVFNNNEVRLDFFYDFLERYCDSDEFAAEFDSNLEGWKKYMSSDRDLK